MVIQEKGSKSTTKIIYKTQSQPSSMVITATRPKSEKKKRMEQPEGKKIWKIILDSG